MRQGTSLPAGSWPLAGACSQPGASPTLTLLAGRAARPGLGLSACSARGHTCCQAEQELSQLSGQKPCSGAAGGEALLGAQALGPTSRRSGEQSKPGRGCLPPQQQQEASGHTQTHCGESFQNAPRLRLRLASDVPAREEPAPTRLSKCFQANGCDSDAPAREEPALGAAADDR